MLVFAPLQLGPCPSPLSMKITPAASNALCIAARVAPIRPSHGFRGGRNETSSMSPVPPQTHSHRWPLPVSGSCPYSRVFFLGELQFQGFRSCDSDSCDFCDRRAPPKKGIAGAFWAVPFGQAKRPVENLPRHPTLSDDNKRRPVSGMRLGLATVNEGEHGLAHGFGAAQRFIGGETTHGASDDLHGSVRVHLPMRESDFQENQCTDIPKPFKISH